MHLTKIIDNKISIENFVENKVNISGVTNNSRLAKKGMLFVAIRGSKNDGLNYLSEAIKKGISAVLVSSEIKRKIDSENINLLKSTNIRLSVSRIAKVFYPKQPKNIVAVTGTNGKTSILHYLKYIWKKNNYKYSSIGTYGIQYDNITKETNLTTPDPIILHKEIQSLKNKKIDNLVMEASSHAIHQHRLDSIKINCAIFTNLTRDHMDYHINMENYFQCKKRLFTEILEKKGLAIVNTDKKYGKLIKQACIKKNIKCVTYGYSECDWKLLEVKRKNNFSEVKVKNKDKIYQFSCRLFSSYQIENLIAALIVAKEQGMPLKKIFNTLIKIKNPEGRLDKINDVSRKKLSIFIDYAHSPNSLENSLKELKKIKREGSSLILLFGCGGDRDQGKRIHMAKVANAFADVIYITDDNPRTENPSHIRKQLSQICKKSINIGNRRKAINAAIKSMKKEDILLIAGKGHEKFQEIGNRKIPFSDKTVVKEALIRNPV